jgi:hypothetical protein
MNARGQGCGGKWKKGQPYKEADPTGVRPNGLGLDDEPISNRPERVIHCARPDQVEAGHLHS